MKPSKFFSLNPRTQAFIKGLVMAVFGGVVAIIGPSIESGEFVFNWTMIWHTAVASALAYLGKNLLAPTPTAIQIDPSKTSVIDKKTKDVILNSKK
jgi:hypothetical protein